MVALAIARLAVFALSVAMLAMYFANAPSLSDVFLWHPVSMTLSFVALLPEALFLARHARITKSRSESESSQHWHAFRAFLLKFIALVGTATIVVVKIEKKREHFTTVHGQLGIATMAVLFFQLSIGVLMTGAAPQVKALIGPSVRGKMKKAHQLSGYLLALLVSVSFWLGWRSSYGKSVLPTGFEALADVFGSAPAFGIVVAFLRSAN